MARLPTVGGDTDAWGTVLNEYLQVAHESDGNVKTSELGSGATDGTKFLRDDRVWAAPAGGGTAAIDEFTLASSSSAGAAAITLDRAPVGISLGGGFVVIEPYTTNCEIRRVSSVAGAVVTLTRAQTVSGSTISFAAATKRITGTTETVSKFFPGARITVSGSSSNNGSYTVADYPPKGVYEATYITVNETLVDESAGAAVTIVCDLNRAHATGSRVLWAPGPIPATWYGAKASATSGDAANNRLGLQRMLDDASYAQAWDLYLPGFVAGRYFIDAPLYVETLIHLRGVHQKGSVIAASSGFPVWNDDVAMIQTRRNGRVCKPVSGGNDRYYFSHLGLDGVSVAYLKSPGWTTVQRDGTGYTPTATNTFAIHASLTAKVNESAGLVCRAVAGGTGGNAIRVAAVNDGASQPLTVSVSGNDITVHLATNGSSVVTSTATLVKDAINAHGGASALIQASLLVGDDGSGLVAVFALTTLTAGAAPFVAGDIGRSIYVGRREGARNITAVPNAYTVTVDGDAWAYSQAGATWVVSPVNGMIGAYNQTSIINDVRVSDCPGYGFGTSDTQEVTVKNLMVNGCGIPLRLYDTQFAHFYDTNCEKGSDCFVSFESSGPAGGCRCNYFIGGHFEGQAMPVDLFRSCKDLFEGHIFESIIWTVDKASTVLKLRNTTNALPSSYGITNFTFSGPNSGPLVVDDVVRGYSLLMTDFGVLNANYTVDHIYVRDGMIQANRNVQSKTAAYTMRIMDQLVLASATGGAFTVTLPSAVGIKGMEFTVKRTNSGANAVTVGTTSSQTIDGVTTVSLAAQYDRVRVVSDGTNWQRVDGAAAAAGGGGGGGWPKVYKSGDYYTVPSSSNPSSNTIAMTLDQVLYVPLAVGEAQTFNEIAVSVTTLGATSVVRLGMYTSTDGRPDALVADYGTVDASGTGYLSITISQALTAGTLYWVAIVAQVAVCTLRATGTGVGSEWVGHPGVTNDIRTCNYIQAGVTGALPATATTAVGITQSPISKLRAA